MVSAADDAELLPADSAAWRGDGSGFGVTIDVGVDIGLGVAVGTELGAVGTLPQPDIETTQATSKKNVIILFISIPHYASAASSPASDFFLNFSDLTRVSA